jgi:hypothetical protein
MKHLLTALLVAIFSGQAFAFFSDHAIITPKNLAKHEEFKIWTYCTKNDPDMVNVVLPFHEGDKKYWLFSCSRELSDKELNFREVIWQPYKPIPDYVRGIVPIAPILDDSGKVPEGSFIRLKIRKAELPTTYIYQDFAKGVDDGGFYRTYKISSFPIGTGIDPLMEIEWDISHFQRIGDNAKHRESEDKLRKLLADKAFMSEFGQRYKAVQAGSGQPATRPKSKSEASDKPQPESEGRSR